MEFWQPCFSFSEIQFFWFKIWKQDLTFFPKVRFYLKKRFFRVRSQFCQVCWKVFANSSRFIHQNQKLFQMFCFFKNYLSPKSSPGNVKCIFESAAEKFPCQKLPNLLPTSEEVYTFRFFFKKMFTKNFSWIRRKQARQHFNRLSKVNFFSRSPLFFH